VKAADGINIHRRRVALTASSLKVVDLVCELVDARCPKASGSPAVNRLITGKQHLLVLNKADLADPRITKAWLDFFKGRGREAVAVDSRSGRGWSDLLKMMNARTMQLHRSLQLKGRNPRGIRVAVLGIPNTGKSTFLNRLIGQRAMRTGDRPGVTRGPQWVHLGEGISVLDTPGIISISRVGSEGRFKLGAAGSLDLHSRQAEDTCEQLLTFLSKRYPAAVISVLKLSPDKSSSPDKLGSPGPAVSLEEIAGARGFLMSSGIPDTQRACTFLLDQFRSGKLGRISLEEPE
jgi:ribosome biogenesis GTPase A